MLLAVLMFSGTAYADEKGDCGTVILPVGIGITASADLTSFNPLLSDSIYNAEAAQFLYMDLIWINRFHKIDWSRSLASAISSPDDGKTYDVTLRNWHWSDGVAVTSTDIAFTWRLIQQLGTNYPGYGQGGMPDIIQQLKLLDATHFQVVLRRPVNPLWFIYDGLAQLQPLPEHSWGKYTLDEIWQNQSSPDFFSVVNGPLKLKRLDIGLDALFVPNTAYEGPKLHFNRLVMRFLDNDGAELQGIESGELDMANLPHSLWSEGQKFPGVYATTLPPLYSWDMMVLNFENIKVDFFKDVRVRQAMADAINQNASKMLVDHGAGVEIYGPVPPLPVSDFLSPAMRAGHYPVGYDPAKSRALLTDAGYAPGPDGIMQRDGKKLSFDLLTSTGNAATTETIEMAQRDLRAVGIDMKIKEIDFNQLLSLMIGAPEKWQATALGQSLGNYPSGEGTFETGAFENDGHYSDKTMDRLIDESVNKPGLGALYAFEDYASAQQPYIFMQTGETTVLSRNRIHGVENFIDPEEQYAPDQLYCTPGAGH